MKIKVDIKLPESNLKTICLDDSCFFVVNDDNKVLLNTKMEDRLNTLIGLFGCKSIWKNEVLAEPIYRVTFFDVHEEIYDFDKAPSNWNMFIGYLDKLVGDSYDL